MKRSIVFVGLICAFLAAVVSGKDEHSKEAPGQTIAMPENYREWVWLSSGLGMSYSPTAGEKDNPEFDNVFAAPKAYKVFKETGTWPDKTVLLLEVRKSGGKESINQGGHYQLERIRLEAHVKDSKLPGGWGFYSFGNGSKTGMLIPKTASCYSCHEQHGAVDTTFVQFYPVLLDVAKAKGKVSTEK